MSRIFLSHSSRDNAEALALRDWLTAQGWSDVFLDIDPERGLVASDRWQKALRSAIGRCRAVLFLLSPDWLKSKHCFSELDLAGHVGAERIGIVIKDVVLENVRGELAGERQVINLTRGGTPVTFAVNPPPARKTVHVTFPGEDLRALRAGLARLGLVGFDPESFLWPPEDEPERAPFRGLEALDTKDAGVFFGRDSDLVRARETLIELRAKGGRKLLVIQGASGSGKSSFLRAGLLPRLERDDMDFLALPPLRVLNGALSGRGGLAASLAVAFERLGQPRASGALLTALENNADVLPPLLNEIQVLAMKRFVGEARPQVERPPTLVLSIDQAEQLYAIDPRQEVEKLRGHLAAALMRGPDTIGIATIRSDRFSLLQRDEAIKELLEPFNLPPVNSAVYADTILKPAARANPPMVVDARLAEALIRDTAAEGADPMPLLAFTLERLYERYGRALHRVDNSNYQALGGLTGSIEAAIAEAFAEPTRAPTIPADRKERERLLEAALIPAFVDINQSNGEPVSRIASEREIPEDARALVSRLVDARILVSDENKISADSAMATTYRVAHEALLRRWTWLRSLLDQKARLLTAAQLVERQAAAWRHASFAKDWLDLRGDRLREAIALAGREDFKKRLQGLPVAYIDACRQAARAELWGRRGSIVSLGLLLAAIAVAWATQSRWFRAADRAVYRMINITKDFTRPGTHFQECASCPQMVVVPAGSFLMGSPESDSDRQEEEVPQHQVKFVNSFAVSKFEITFDQWEACVIARGCRQVPPEPGRDRGNRPANNISWDDAQEYIAWISKWTGNTYRLLSEAEWEYAARGVTSITQLHTRYAWGDTPADGFANCDSCGSEWDKKQSAPVGSFKANAFGLHDMHGNVWEFVQDCWHDNYAGAPADGAAWTTGCAQEDGRVFRGGSWVVPPRLLRSATRYGVSNAYRSRSIGFRLARSLK